MVESLTSYISRLAEVHQLSVGTLVEKVLAPPLGKSYLTKGKGSRFYDHSIELNAFGNQAAEFAHILSTFTGINFIHKLSLLSLKDAFPSRNVFAKTKRWCPICLEEWKHTGSIVYEPLLWSFRSINICAKHNVLLNATCPYCARTLLFLTPASRDGFCSHCGCWLGSNEYKATLDMNPEQLSWEYYVVKSIGDLIKNESNTKFNFDNIYLQLITLIKAFGGVSAFSRSVNIPKSTVSTWIGGGHKPSLDVLLKICYASGIEIIDLFNPNLAPDFLDQKRAIDSSICQNHEYNKASRILDWVSIEKKLKGISENQELNSPSVREAARLIGCNERLLYNHFPDLCTLIAENHRHLIQSMKNKNLEERRKIIIEASTTLYLNGIYPTERNVERLISPLTLRRKNNHLAWKDALITLKIY